MEKKLVTIFNVQFKGIFGRNRTVKFEAGPNVVCEHLALKDQAQLEGLVSAYLADIKAKDGFVWVKRYQDCEEDHYESMQTPGLMLVSYCIPMSFSTKDTALAAAVKGGKIVAGPVW